MLSYIIQFMNRKNGKILIFGGSFDPAHKAHIEVLRDAISFVGPYKVIIVPSWLSPFKNSHWASYDQRKKMLSKVLNEYYLANLCEISDFEAERRKKTYTWQLIKYLKKKYPYSELFFLMGSDSFLSLEKWKNPGYIRKNCKIIVARRKGFETDKKNGILFLNKLYPSLSSTEAREKILKKDFSLLPKSVKKEIISKKLYFYSIADSISKILSKKRFNHTLAVCRLARELSEIWGADSKKAVLAALIHDCAKEFSISKQLKIAGKIFPKKDLYFKAQKAPGIIHQYASAAFARYDLSVKDKEVLNAAASHSLGKKNPDKLSQIIEISDFASYDRRHRSAQKIRKTALKSLKKAFKQMREEKRKYLKNIKAEILPYE